MNRRSFAAATLLALGAAGLPIPGSAQNYPDHAVKIIVPFAPGAGNDILGRLTAEHLTPRLGQPVIVENKVGAGSQIGIDFVAKSKPDGYTVVWAASDGITILPAVKAGMPYKVPDDFTFIARIVQIPFIIGVNPQLPIKNMAELIAYAKANPGTLKYGTSGIGGGPHMGSALIEKAVGVEMLHVPFSGVAPAVNALLAGTIDFALVTPPTIKPQTDAGKIRPIAATGKERSSLFPNVPTVEEQGVPVSVVVWYGILAPAGTPEPVLARLRKEVGDVLKDPAVTARLSQLGYQVSYLAGDEFKDFVVRDLEQWKSVAKSANIVVEQ
jgi:tripartite-type tricarboxylate transporter receptor subunit TctC